jgi:branched-chain amino acid transport system substrate-binding protein
MRGMTQFMRTRIWSLLVATVLLAATACTSSQPPSQATIGEIRIGLLAPLSGDEKAAGTDAVHGAQLAAAVLSGREGAQLRNSEFDVPRLEGSSVRIIPADTGTHDPDHAVTAAVHLATQQGVAGLVGAYDPDATAAASQRSERLPIPFVNGDSSAGFLTERGLDWFFRTGPTDRSLSEAVFSTLGQQAAAGARTRRLGVLYADDAPSNGLAAATNGLASEGGYQIVPQGPVSFPPGPGRDPGASVAKVRAAQPDVVVLIADQPVDAQKIVNAFAAPGFTPAGIFTLGAGFKQPPALQNFVQHGAGLLGSTPWSREAATRNPASKAVVSLYEDSYHTQMSDVAAGTFTAVLTLAAAIDHAHSLEPERIRTALLSLDVPGRSTIMPWSGVRFDATTHQNTLATGLVEQFLQGSFRVIFPRELGLTRVVWPLSNARA